MDAYPSGIPSHKWSMRAVQSKTVRFARGSVGGSAAGTQEPAKKPGDRRFDWWDDYRLHKPNARTKPDDAGRRDSQDTQSHSSEMMNSGYSGFAERDSSVRFAQDDQSAESDTFFDNSTADHTRSVDTYSTSQIPSV